IIPPGKGSNFKRNVRHLLADQDSLSFIVLPLFEAWRSIRLKAAALERRLLADARQSQECRILMSIPGIGVISPKVFMTPRIWFE
ncbi:IS110 family transposase, partial [Rhizobium johnstonii]